MTAEPVAQTEPGALVSLAHDLEPAASSDDVLDLLAVGAGAKPLASATLCYTSTGLPAWDAPDPSGLGRETLPDRLDDLGLVWRLTPVRSGTEDREYTWYDLLVARPGSDGAAYIEAAPGDPSRRTDREYGRALGYPDSAVSWFVGRSGPADRSVFDVVADTHPEDATALVLAASVPYVPAPTTAGVSDAIGDGRELVRSFCRLARAADEPGYVRGLLADRIRGTLDQHDIPEPDGAVVATIPC